MSNLSAQLLAAMEPKLIFRAPIWGSPQAMTGALREVRRALSSNDRGLPATDVLQTLLLRYASTQSVANFTELKHVCYGVTVPVGGNQWRLIDRAPLLQSLLTLVEQRRGLAKQYRRCYQGLLNGYFGFHRAAPSDGGHTNWVQLRSYLDERLSPIVQATAGSGLSLDWLDALATHRNLLTEDPCSRYAEDLRAGGTGELQSLCGALGIASTSWVWDEALMAYVRAVCAGEDDSQFQSDMSGVLALANGRAELKLAEMLCIRATSLTVARYSHCGEKPEHPDLRDTSLRWIGNPWVNRTAWDAHVQHEPARQMVEGWIKRRLIKDFFELLAHDGGADLRRLNYWLKWEPQISDMWFVLGSDARGNPSEAFVDLRNRMVGRRRSLDDPNGQNNAFVMRIGQLLVIEFGITGNACYAFAAADFRGDLERPLLSIRVLKQQFAAKRLSHLGSWEHRFDYELRRLLHSVPNSKGDLPVRHADDSSTSIGDNLSETDVEVFLDHCSYYGIDWEDNRPRKGAFWVLMKDKNQHPVFASLLKGRGFSFTAGKGFWMKDKA